MYTRVLMGALVASSEAFAFAAGDPVSDSCGTGGDREQVECLSKQVDRMSVDLEQVYQAALAKLPEHEVNDTRGSRDQLRKSEVSWLQYEQANCPLMGALQGGSNSWITHFALICQEQEIQARTALLQRIAEGRLGGR